MNNDTLLLRQTHPSWVREDRVTSQLFTPTPKDKGMLSAYDGDQITAEASWKHYTNVLGFQSAGVMTVTLQECQDQKILVTPCPKEFQEHVQLDFRDFSTNQTRNLAKRLTQFARVHGWQYLP